MYTELVKLVNWDHWIKRHLELPPELPGNVLATLGAAAHIGPSTSFPQWIRSASFRTESISQEDRQITFFRTLYIAFSRLYLHPLKTFPGPRLAALTDYYQAFYEVWRNGPVVRVRPNELHCQSAEAYFAIYTPHSGFTKDPFFYNAIVADSVFGTVNVQKHKARRDTINPLFSRRAILKLEDEVQEKVWLLYAHSFGGLTAPGFDHLILRSVPEATFIATASKCFPILLLMHCLPQWLLSMMDPLLRSLVDLKSFLGSQVDALLANLDGLNNANHKTIYHYLITPELIRNGDVPFKKALIDEALVLLIAGTDTASNAMTIGFFHLLSNPTTMEKLQAELQTAWPEKDMPFLYEMAEKLLYLTGVIKEALRLRLGPPVSLPRVAISATIIDGIAVPAGTTVGVGQPFVLKNPNIFPDPSKFKPERWMGPDAQKLDNLAWCELYLTFAHLSRKFDMQLFETSEEDMILRDHMVPLWKDVRPLQAIVSERRIDTVDDPVACLEYHGMTLHEHDFDTTSWTRNAAGPEELSNLPVIWNAPRLVFLVMMFQIANDNLLPCIQKLHVDWDSGYSWRKALDKGSCNDEFWTEWHPHFFKCFPNAVMLCVWNTYPSTSLSLPATSLAPSITTLIVYNEGTMWTGLFSLREMQHLETRDVRRTICTVHTVRRTGYGTRTMSVLDIHPTARSRFGCMPVAVLGYGRGRPYTVSLINQNNAQYP
ncbi:cytochrome P450 [Mucidula mucida]|nr:cytochrome P450 [Mucidula mucida]